jgi:hypothetical protein
MRWTTLALAALTGIAAGALASPAGAFTPNSSAGLRPAAESIDPVASVHCRPYKHRSYNHGWSYGCGRGGGVHVSIHEREGRHGRVGVHEREGGRVSVHERSSTRSETNVRSRESTRARGEVKSGSTRSSTEGRSGTTGNRSETGKGTGGGGTTGHSSGSGGGTSGQSSGGQQH